MSIRYLLLIIYTSTACLLPSVFASASAAAGAGEQIAPNAKSQTASNFELEPLSSSLPVPALHNLIAGYLDGYQHEENVTSINTTHLEQLKPAAVSANGQYMVIITHNQEFPLDGVPKSTALLTIYKDTDKQFEHMQNIPLAGEVNKIALSPDGTYMAVNCDNKIRLYALKEQKYVEEKILLDDFTDITTIIDTATFFRYKNELYFGVILGGVHKINGYIPHRVIGIWEFKGTEFQQIKLEGIPVKVTDPLISSSGHILLTEIKTDEKNQSTKELVVLDMSNKYQGPIARLPLGISSNIPCINAISADGQYIACQQNLTSQSFGEEGKALIKIWRLQNNQFKEMETLSYGPLAILISIFPSSEADTAYICVKIMMNLYIIKISNGKHMCMAQISTPLGSYLTSFHPLDSGKFILLLNSQNQIVISTWQNDMETIRKSAKKL
jgi:WD40 repeat protein